MSIVATTIFAVLGRRGGSDEGHLLTAPFPSGPGAAPDPGIPPSGVDEGTTARSISTALATISPPRSAEEAGGVSGLMADSRPLVAAVHAVGGNAWAAIELLGESRSALASGDVRRARRALTTANEILTGQLLALLRQNLGQLWELVEAVREFGGDPTLSNVPMSEGRRFLAAGKVVGAYDLLEQARRLLIEQLTPSVRRRMGGLLPRVRSLTVSADDAAGVARAVTQVGESIRRHRYADAVRAYRRLDSLVDTLEMRSAVEPTSSKRFPPPGRRGPTPSTTPPTTR